MGHAARVYVVGRVQPEVSSCSTASDDDRGDEHRVAPKSYTHECPVWVRRGTRWWWATSVLHSNWVMNLQRCIEFGER